MSTRDPSEKETAEVVRLLAPLASERASLPPSDVVYWRAQARLQLGEASRRRGEALRPLLLFHLAIGVGAIAVAVLASILPLFTWVSLGRAELVTFPLVIVMVAVGAHLLAEPGTVS